MELPKTVTIDLYPDMKAKALGSGAAWTPANTITYTHIAEVYNQGYQCDSFHELAHIFSYHFPNNATGDGVNLVEAFAVYFERDNRQMQPIIEDMTQQLNAGNLRSLDQILLDGYTAPPDAMAFIDYLLRKDLNKYKVFYVRVRLADSVADLEKACLEIYETDLKGLELQWHSSLSKNN